MTSDTIQGFLINLGIKQRLHILKLSIFSLSQQNYQNYEQPLQSLQNLYVLSKSLFVMKNQLNLSDFFFCEEYLTRRLTFINQIS